MLFHCIAEDEVTRNQLVDIVSMQNDRRIDLFNSNRIDASGDFPLDYRGSPVPSALRYPDLMEKHEGGNMILSNSTVQEMVMVNTNIFGGIVRMTTEVIKTNI